LQACAGFLKLHYDFRYMAPVNLDEENSEDFSNIKGVPTRLSRADIQLEVLKAAEKWHKED
jgi:hypothetical protein